MLRDVGGEGERSPSRGSGRDWASRTVSRDRCRTIIRRAVASGWPRDAAAQGRLRWWSSAGLIALAELAVDTGDDRAARLLGEAAELAGGSGAHRGGPLAAGGAGAM